MTLHLPIVALLLVIPLQCHALGEPQHVTFTPQTGSFPLSTASLNPNVYVDPADWRGVLRAAHDLASDLASVTGRTPQLLQSAPTRQPTVILIGTLGRSPLIDRLVAAHKLDVAAIQGHWETSVTQVVEHPMPGIDRALVLAGADKRGTIFAIYDLSEQIGVSPWVWWADVPVPHRDALYLIRGRYIQPEPRVRYRGIFLNDEAPALSGWTTEKFGGYNSKFYTHIFELLLRLKANFLWPAMWNSAFAKDDPLNPQLADEYGIVMSTSHEEPMMRAEKEWSHAQGPWDYTTNAPAIDEFWRTGMQRNKACEQVVTLGMRGINDTAMSPDTNTQKLEAIVADQRKILQQTVNPDLTKVPQVWALYKEVQTYYDKGMRVPDDVTLLWSDDNWGNLRRLPTPEERKRPGGAGIYYHFDYVGGPRSYKWLNTYSITKVWEQMHLAVEYGADRIWVVNVGDLKPMEFPIEFFLNYARTPDRWNADNLQQYTRLWATREFGPEHATDIASLVASYTKFNSRRKPEQLEPDTFSFTQDHEADRIDQDWRDLTARAERISAELSEAARPAFFEVVLYPLKASAIVNELYIAAGRNHLYATQGRASANLYADEARILFAADAALSAEYNHALNGKWNHMMDQTHIGYTFWNEPPLNAMPAVQLVQPLPGAHMLVFPESSTPFRPALPVFDSVNNQTRTIELANRGSEPYSFTATASAPWVHLSVTSGIVTADQPLTVTIDWKQFRSADSKATIVLTQGGVNPSPPVTIAVEAVQLAESVTGFIENNGIVSMEAEHFTSQHESKGVSWQLLPNYGETLSAMETFPVTAPSQITPGACLDYRINLFTSGPRTVQAILAPTSSFVPGRGLRYALALDSESPVIVDAWASNTLHDWEQAVSDGVHKVSTSIDVKTAGSHTLHFCMVDPALVLEKLVITPTPQPSTRTLSIPAEYLGPPESAHRNAK